MAHRLAVLELFCKDHDARGYLHRSFPRQGIDYTGIDRDASVGLHVGSRALPPGNKIRIQKLHVCDLALDDPGRLELQLREKLRGQHFDLVYALMPATVRNLADQPGALPVVAGYLKPGGQLVHVAEASNHFLGVSLRNHTELPLGRNNVEEIYAVNRSKLRQLADRAGLRLVQYAQMPEDALWQARYGWHSSDPDFKEEKLEDMLNALSRSAQYSRHVVVFEKAHARAL